MDDDFERQKRNMKRESGTTAHAFQTDILTFKKAEEATHARHPLLFPSLLPLVSSSDTPPSPPAWHDSCRSSQNATSNQNCSREELPFAPVLFLLGLLVRRADDPLRAAAHFGLHAHVLTLGSSQTYSFDVASTRRRRRGQRRGNSKAGRGRRHRPGYYLICQEDRGESNGGRGTAHTISLQPRASCGADGRGHARVVGMLLVVVGCLMRSFGTYDAHDGLVLLMLLSGEVRVRNNVMGGRLLLLALVLVVLPSRSWEPSQGVVDERHAVVARRMLPWPLQKSVLRRADLWQSGSWHRLPPPYLMQKSLLSTADLSHPGSWHRLPPP